MYGDFPAKDIVYTPCLYMINVWLPYMCMYDKFMFTVYTPCLYTPLYIYNSCQPYICVDVWIWPTLVKYTRVRQKKDEADVRWFGKFVRNSWPE